MKDQLSAWSLGFLGLQHSSRSWKDMQENFGIFGKKTKNIQNPSKKIKNVWHQRNAKYIDIL